MASTATAAPEAALQPERKEVRVADARFSRAAQRFADLPPAEAPEVAFLGRSNVGKSSLLGALLGRPKLVRVSRTPGRTRDVNLFSVDVLRVGDGSERRALTFADLPGYGFARASAQERARMGELLSHYLERREGLRAVCQLFDLRHRPSADDLQVHAGLVGQRFTVLRVATKADKLPRSKRKAARRALAEALKVAFEEVVLFSAPERMGRDELWELIWEATS